MNKNEFLNDKFVKSFVIWMTNHLSEDGEILHSWTAKSSKAAPQKGDVLVFTSLYDAYEKFYWRSENPITNARIEYMRDTSACLQDMGISLNKAIDENDGQATYECCKWILQWGGVYYKSNIAKDIKLINEIDNAKLPIYLREIRRWLQSDPCVGSEFEFKFNDDDYFFEVDSGTTKIYSLLSSSWIIYDGRVGSALGMLVAMWANEEEIDIPAILRFAHAREPNRNPNPIGSRIFPVIKNDSMRLEYNLRANWLLNEILSQSDIGKFASLDDVVRLRALEASLFMIGYSVPRFIAVKFLNKFQLKK